MKDQQRCGFANFIRSDLRYIDIARGGVERNTKSQRLGETAVPTFIGRGAPFRTCRTNSPHLRLNR
jgi:hypothetical protein